VSARYIMVGGFLGAGKSTALARLARWLTDRGSRVGLITNDQGSGLVDTLRLRAGGWPVEEIAGGCFCCRFDSLKAAADALTRDTRPDVFLAEPVGSCTDLVASVSYPLRRIYGADFTIAPLSVLLDPERALRLFGLKPGGRFSDKVAYVYRKQLEEADLIVVNKADVASPEDLTRLDGYLAHEFPHAERLVASAREGNGLDAWFARVASGTQSGRRAMELDYDRYADGEAQLGWLNATLSMWSTEDVEARAVLEGLARDMQRRLAQRGAEVAHLKMTLSPTDDPAALAWVSLVRSDFVPELGQDLPAPVRSASLVLNLRAEASPDDLSEIVEESVGASPHGVSLEHLECFAPPRPVPTHRDEAPEAHP